MERKPAVVRNAEWSREPGRLRGPFEGARVGADMTVLFYRTDEVGAGARWHVHPYDELFVIREGRALFTVGTEKSEASAGDVVFGPAGVPHKLRNLGPGPFETTDIHDSPRWIQTDLDDPEEA